LLQQCDPATINLVGQLNLTDYHGRHYYEGAVRKGRIARDEVIFINKVDWIAAILQGHADANEHVGTADPLDLDDGQEEVALGTGLNVPGQQAIPLEDRYSQYKPSFGNARNVAGLDVTLMNAWHAAKGRRLASTTDAPTYVARRLQVTNKLTAYGNLNTLVPALQALRVRLAALPTVADHTLRVSLPAMVQLDTDVDIWINANAASAIALALLTPLINKANWSTKGEAFIGTKVPDGVQLMRTELAAGNNAATTLTNLGAIAVVRLRNQRPTQVTNDMYQLARDTPGWIAGAAAGWNHFVAKYNTTNGAV
jgi:hypothetical protein